MIFKNKFDEDKAIYSFSDRIDQIFLVNDVEVLDKDSEILILKQEFPIGLIEENLGSTSRLEYRVKKGSKFNILNDNQKEDYDHIIGSFNRFHSLYSEKYEDDPYFLEQCLLPETIRFIFESICENKVELEETYIFSSLKKDLYKEYVQSLKILCRYFYLFPVSELAFWKSRNNKAKTYFFQEKYDFALKEFMEISSSMEFLIPEIYNFISKCNYYLNDLSKASEYALKAIDLDEKYIPAINNLAVYSIYQKDFAGAEEYWEKILKIDSKNAKAKKNLKILRENIK